MFEFFFCGFVLYGIKWILGFGVVFVMMILYCMIYFGKLFFEMLGVLIVGFVLGFMSLKMCLVWLGCVLYIVVVLMMDFVLLVNWLDVVK